MAKKETKAKTGGTKPQTSAETEKTYASIERPSEARTEAPAHRLSGAETRDQASGAPGAGRGIDKIRDEMAGSKDSKIQLLGEGLTAMLQLHPELEKYILEKGKTIQGALEEVRKNATGGASDPVQTTKSLCGYYGIKCENPHVLALEVTVQMMGGEAAAEGTAKFHQAHSATAPSEKEPSGGQAATDPFDLDSILGVL